MVSSISARNYWFFFARCLYWGNLWRLWIFGLRVSVYQLTLLHLKLMNTRSHSIYPCIGMYAYKTDWCQWKQSCVRTAAVYGYNANSGKIDDIRFFLWKSLEHNPTVVFRWKVTSITDFDISLIKFTATIILIHDFDLPYWIWRLAKS